MLFNTVAICLLSTCEIDFALLVSFTSAAFGIAYISTASLISGCFVDSPDNSLTESSLLSEGLFQLRASVEEVILARGPDSSFGGVAQCLLIGNVT